jgi:hypothetical protein
MLISSLSVVLGLFDGGEFMTEVTVEEGVRLGQDFQEDVCPFGDWLDVFLVPSISPVVESSKLEIAEHKDKLAGMEVVETEHVGDEEDYDEGAQLPEKTDPLPLTVQPLGLSVAPLISTRNDEPAEVEKNLLRSEMVKVLELENITETKSIEDEKKSDPPLKSISHT